MILNKFVFGIFLGLVSVVTTTAQVNRYMVFFKDKSGTPFSTSNPSLYLSQKAIERRTKQSIAVTELDLPVNPNYLQNVRATGASTFFKTRWMNGVLVQCDASLIPTIQAIACVKSVEKVAPNARLMNSGRVMRELKNNAGNVTGASTQVQLQMLGVDKMHNDGFHGEGITIAVLDAGFPGVNTTDPFQLLRNDSRINIDASYNFVNNTTNIFQFDSHGTEVLSVIAAYQESIFTGGAYKADFQLYITEDVATEYRIEEYNWLFAAERADSAGADIISTSLGYNEFDDPGMDYDKSDLDGKTAVITKAAQFAADRGMLVIASAGNEGANSWQTITPPSDAVDVLAVANITTQGTRNVTSSIGPSADNRIKPDLAALGTNVSIITPSGSVSTISGTSLAAPLITSLAAGVWQRYPDLTNKAIVEVMRKTASQANQPDNLIGYGIPNYKAVNNYLLYTPQTKVFEVYPNPFLGTINISPKNPVDISACRFQCVTLQGQVLADYNIEFNWLNPTSPIDLTNLSAGMYIVRLWYNNAVYVFKVVKR